MAAVGELADRVEALCRGPLASKALRERLIALLGRTMLFDGYNFPLTDPVSRVFTSPLADVPGLSWPRLPELIRLRYLTTVGRWDRLMDTGVETTSLLLATAGHPEQSLLWYQVQRGLGVSDTASVVFFDRFGMWGLLDLWRLGGQAFSDRELQTLAALVRPVTAGLRAAMSRTFLDPDQQLQPIGPAVIILDPDLQVRNQTEAAAEALLRLNPPDEPMEPIPAAAYNIGAALVAAEHGVPLAAAEPSATLGPISSRIHLGGSRWVTAKASRLGTDIAVSIEPSTPAERLDLYARCAGLTAREREVLTLLGDGMESRQIAERLFISQHTANDHVKALLAKTGARTRQQLLARGLGAH